MSSSLDLGGVRDSVERSLDGDACSKDLLVECLEQGGRLSMPEATKALEEWEWSQLSYRFDKLACRKGGLDHPLITIERLEPEHEGESAPRVAVLTELGREVASSGLVSGVREQREQRASVEDRVESLEESVSELEGMVSELRTENAQLRDTVDELESLIPLIRDTLPERFRERLELLESLEKQVSEMRDEGRPEVWEEHYRSREAE